MPLAHLSIGTATDRINLLDSHGYHAGDWRPQAEPHEDTFASSALADYRQLTSYRQNTTIETIPLTLRRPGQDACIEMTQDLRRMLVRARDYWASNHEGGPVYLEARASCETETRYAVVHTGRVPEDSNPYGQPFLQRARWAVMEQVLLVERGPWLSLVPGENECIELSSTGPGGVEPVYFLEFGQPTSDVDCGSGATLDDLPLADMTAEAWVRADDAGGLTLGRLYSKYTWEMHWFGGTAFVVYAVHATTAITQVPFIPDGAWHHVAAVWDQGALTWHIAIDGAWPVPTSQVVGAGAYGSDAAASLHIGSDGGVRNWNGGIGWCRLSSNLRYTPGTPFTPPDRCAVPAADGNTVEIWGMQEGTGATAAAAVTTPANDGAITDCTWGRYTDCDELTVGREDTCLDEVFVANKHTYAALTDVWYWDASAAAWSANLVAAALPFPFMPPAPLQVNDVVLFGIDSGVADTGPFSSLVFDIATAINPGGGLTIDWRYSSVGADIVTAPWNSLTVQDNTNADGLGTGDPFDTAGVKSGHWEQPAAWAAYNPTVNGGAALGVTAYWVAAIVTAAAGAPTPPTQQNRAIYTVNWPSVRIDEGQTAGDIPMLATLTYRPQSDKDGGSTDPKLQLNRLIVGARSLVRDGYDASGFTAYWPASDRQMPALVTCTAGGAGAFANDMQSPTGRIIQCVNPAAAWANACYWTAQVGTSRNYQGAFHVYLRCAQVTGAAGDVRFRLWLATTDATTPVHYTEEKVLKNVTDNPSLIDFGQQQFVSKIVLSSWRSTLVVGVDVYGNGVADADLFDIILMPVDEWAGDFRSDDVDLTIGARGLGTSLARALAIDSTLHPRLHIASWVDQGNQIVWCVYQSLTSKACQVRQEGDQRLWFLAGLSSAARDYYPHEAVATVQAYKAARYLSMRGSR